jgi:hypothetical protein
MSKEEKQIYNNVLCHIHKSPKFSLKAKVENLLFQQALKI